MSADQPDQVAGQAERIESDLSAIRRALRRPLDTEVARGRLTVPQTVFMRVVVRDPGISLKELSRELSLAHSTVSGIADRLEKQGLLERRVDAQDRRIVRFYPTTPVTEFVRDRIPVLRVGPLQAALERANISERAAIERALRHLRELLGDS